MTSEKSHPSPPLASALTMGILAAALFSSTFVLNSWLSDGRGHWFWTAALRYLFVWLMLTCYLGVRQQLSDAIECLRMNLVFWVTAGGIGFASFYLLLCYASVHSPGWIVASTWQFTVVASVVVLHFLGGSVSLGALLASVIVFTGVTLVNSSHFGIVSSEMVLAVIPVLVAAFCFPIGNQLLLFATSSTPRPNREPHHTRLILEWIPRFQQRTAKDSFGKVWLMTSGALPVLAIVGLIVRPAPPTQTQIETTLLIAVSTGVFGTTALLKARDMAGTAAANRIAAVDATQSMEVPLAVVVECLWFDGQWPNFVGATGIGLVLLGLWAHLFAGSHQSVASQTPAATIPQNDDVGNLKDPPL